MTKVSLVSIWAIFVCLVFLNATIILETISKVYTGTLKIIKSTLLSREVIVKIYI